MSTRRRPYTDRRARIRRSLDSVDALILAAEDEKSDLDLRGHLANYAVLRLSGALENSVGEIIHIYLDRSSDDRLTKYVEVGIRRLTNLDSKKIEGLFAQFSTEWHSTVSAFLDIDENRQNLNSLMGKRNTLAHGGSTSVTMRDIHTYRVLVGDLTDVALDLVDPRGGPARRA